MSSEDLSEELRPNTFEEMIGAEKLIKQIRSLMSSEHTPRGLMFTGETGVGKTTLADIIAVSLQCRHQKVFGHPCRHCRKHKEEFDIDLINGSQLTAKEAVEERISGMNYAPKPGSRYRIYKLEEAHKMSDSAQNMLLVPTEKCPRTTKWILNTTRPDKIIPTLQSRFNIFYVPG